MTEGFHIQHPMAFLIPIMTLFVVIQLVARRDRRRGKTQEWPKAAAILLLVALCVVAVFARFR